MSQTDSLKRLIENYRLKVIMGEKHIDPASMVRDRCKYHKGCRGTECPEFLKHLPPFEKWIRVDRFVGEYMTGIADLAADGRSPDFDWSNELAIKKGMLDILEDCVNAGAEQEVRFRKLIPMAIAETAAFDADDQKAKFTPARDELLLDTYRWLRPRVSSQLAGGNQGTLKGRVFSDSIMGSWTVKFLEGLSRFNQNGRVRRVKREDKTELVVEPFPSEQLVGNFLNFMGAQGQYTILEKRRRVLRHAAASVDGDVEDESMQRDEQVELKEWQQHVFTSVTDAILAMPEPHRSVFQLMDIEGKSMAEAADILGKTVNSLKNLRRSGKAMLQELIPIQG